MVDAGGRGADGEELRERLQRLGSALGVEPDGAVILVADPPGEAEIVGATAHRLAESDSLHATMNRRPERHHPRIGSVSRGHRVGGWTAV